MSHFEDYNTVEAQKHFPPDESMGPKINWVPNLLGFLSKCPSAIALYTRL